MAVCLAPPPVRSGRHGFVMEYTAPVTNQRMSRIRNWTLDTVTNPLLRVYSGTRFGTQRERGIPEYQGSFAGWGSIPPLFAGDNFVFLGYTAPDSGQPCTTGCAYSVPAIVSELTINWSWTHEERRSDWVINFMSRGAATFIPDFDDPCDDALYCPDFQCLCPLFWDCYEVEFDFCNIHAATLTFNPNLIEYSNCSTICQKQRIAGNLDWSLDIMDHNNCKIPIIGDEYHIVIPTDAAGKTWDLKWGHHSGVTNYLVDIENGAVIGKTSRFDMQAINCCVDPELGVILDPNLRQVWPYQIGSS